MRYPEKIQGHRTHSALQTTLNLSPKLTKLLCRPSCRDLPLWGIFSHLSLFLRDPLVALAVSKPIFKALAASEIDGYPTPSTKIFYFSPGAPPLRDIASLRQLTAVAGQAEFLTGDLNLAKSAGTVTL